MLKNHGVQHNVGNLLTKELTTSFSRRNLLHSFSNETDWSY